MIKTEIRQKVYDLLLPVCGEREALGIERIIWEDFVMDESKFPNEELSDADQTKVTELVEQVKTGHPIQYLVGKASFYNMQLDINANVLIPRPETEELVFNFLNSLKKEALPVNTILDVGTGSGCIALAIKQAHPAARVIALDKSEAALEVAQQNAKKLDLDIEFLQMDILDKANWEKLPELGAIISNPPYIPEKEKAIMEQNVKMHEPSMALFVSDEDPIVFYNAIAELGKEKLVERGLVFAEINANLPSETMGVLILNGYQEIQLLKDMSQRHRILTGLKA